MFVYFFHRSDQVDKGIYSLVVRATDAGNPPLYSDVKVTVTVGSTGNQKPISGLQHRFATPISGLRSQGLLLCHGGRRSAQSRSTRTQRAARQLFGGNVCSNNEAPIDDGFPITP